MPTTLALPRGRREYDAWRIVSIAILSGSREMSKTCRNAPQWSQRSVITRYAFVNAPYRFPWNLSAMATLPLLFSLSSQGKQQNCGFMATFCDVLLDVWPTSSILLELVEFGGRQGFSLSSRSWRIHANNWHIERVCEIPTTFGMHGAI